MRTEHSIKNMYIGVSTQVIIAILGFVSRKVFLDSLGLTYLGINGLLTNVLAMLALVESGIGAGSFIVYINLLLCRTVLRLLLSYSYIKEPMRF